MTHGSLFSGIGGFDLAAQWMGWTNVFQCEIDSFCQKILKHHFPNTHLHYDIKQTDFRKYRGVVEIISGGFPCQPFSLAGKRRGTNDNRYLWDEMFRAIREISPRWIVGENVLGIVNWNEGLVFEKVCSDLETSGYEVQPFVLPSCGTNAPHQRYRVWFIAHANFERRGGLRNTSQKKRTPKSDELFNEQYPIPNWDNFPTQSPVCCGNDGIPTRLDDITVSKWIKKSIQSYGNAVVPQVPYRIFSAIEDYENLINNNQ
jgi:DNA (cytosine-5)-methyltransferase 1